MPEEQGVAGDYWTEQAVRLLTACGWSQRGTTRRDIPCTVCRPKPKRATSHGVDAVVSYYNPFFSREIGVLVETKNYGWDNLNTARIQEWVSDLVKKLECVPQSERFVEEFNPDSVGFDTALLLIWCNTHEQYDRTTFADRVQQIDIPRRHANLRVFVASNSEIEQWRSLTTLHERLKADLDDFAVFYPSDGKSALQKRDLLSLELMYSKYVFGKGTRRDRRGDSTKESFVFMFEPATLDSLHLAYVAAKNIQLEECDELRFFLYESNPQLRRGVVDSFVRSTNDTLSSQNAICRVSVEFIPQVRGLA